MQYEFIYSDRYDANQFLIYHGEVPDAVGKWVAVVRAGTPKKESWIFCSDSQIQRLREKYKDDFIRIAGKVLIDRKPVRIPRVESYVVQLSEEEEEAFLAMGDENAKSIKSGEWNEAKSLAPEYNPLLDVPRLVKGVSSLSAREREFFNLWRDRIPHSTIAAMLKLARDSAGAFRAAIRKKLSDYVGSKDPKDFERRIQAIPPVIKRLVDANVEQTIAESQRAKIELTPLKQQSIPKAKSEIKQSKERPVRKFEQLRERRLPASAKPILIFDLQEHFPSLKEGLATLTPTERRFFDLWIKGSSMHDLGRIMKLSQDTVLVYRRHIRKKLGECARSIGFAEFDQSIVSAWPKLSKYLGEEHWLNVNSTELPEAIDITELTNGLVSLTLRERMYLDLWVKGTGPTELERIMNISPNTTKDYRQIIRRKLARCIGAVDARDFDRRLLLLADDLHAHSITQQNKQSEFTFDLPRFAAKLADLTLRQREYFDLWADGRTSSETENKMAISHRTAREYRKLIRNKLSSFIGATDISDFENGIRSIAPRLKEYLAGSFVPDASIPEPERVEKSAPILKPAVITFNDFLQAYGSRKDAIKALEQFNRIPSEQRPSIMADITKYKASLVHANYQMSPYQYLMGRSWMK